MKILDTLELKSSKIKLGSNVLELPKKDGVIATLGDLSNSEQDVIFGDLQAGGISASCIVVDEVIHSERISTSCIVVDGDISASCGTFDGSVKIGGDIHAYCGHFEGMVNAGCVYTSSVEASGGISASCGVFSGILSAKEICVGNEPVATKEYVDTCISTLEGEVQEAVNELSAKVSSVYKYVGSVETEEALKAIDTTNLNNGDVYNVTATDENWALIKTETETKWDKLGSTIDLAPYALKTDVSGCIAAVEDKIPTDYLPATKDGLFYSVDGAINFNTCGSRFKSDLYVDRDLRVDNCLYAEFASINSLCTGILNVDGTATFHHDFIIDTADGEVFEYRCTSNRIRSSAIFDIYQKGNCSNQTIISGENGITTSQPIKYTGSDIIISEDSCSLGDSGSGSSSEGSGITDPIFVTDKAVVKYVNEKIEEDICGNYLPATKCTSCRYKINDEICFDRGISFSSANGGCICVETALNYKGYEVATKNDIFPVTKCSDSTNIYSNSNACLDVYGVIARSATFLGKVEICGDPVATEEYVDDAVKAVEDKIPTDFYTTSQADEKFEKSGCASWALNEAMALVSGCYLSARQDNYGHYEVDSEVFFNKSLTLRGHVCFETYLPSVGNSLRDAVPGDLALTTGKYVRSLISSTEDKIPTDVYTTSQADSKFEKFGCASWALDEAKAFASGCAKAVEDKIPEIPDHLCVETRVNENTGFEHKGVKGEVEFDNFAVFQDGLHSCQMVISRAFNASDLITLTNNYGDDPNLLEASLKVYQDQFYDNAHCTEIGVKSGISTNRPIRYFGDDIVINDSGCGDYDEGSGDTPIFVTDKAVVKYIGEKIEEVEDKFSTNYLPATVDKSGRYEVLLKDSSGLVEFRDNGSTSTLKLAGCGIWLEGQDTNITIETLARPRINISGKYKPLEDGDVTTKYYVDDVVGSTKDYVDDKISLMGSAFNFKGNSTYENLPLDSQVGDVYNISQDYPYIENCTSVVPVYKKGDNLAWTEEGWVKLENSVALSEYYDKREVDDKLEGYLPATLNESSNKYEVRSDVFLVGHNNEVGYLCIVCSLKTPGFETYSGKTEFGYGIVEFNTSEVYLSCLDSCVLKDRSVISKKYVDDSISTLESAIATDYATKVELQSTVDNGVLTEDIALTGGTLSGDQFSWEIAPSTGITKLLAVVTMDPDGNIVTPTYKWDKTNKKVKVTVYSTTAVSDNTYTTTITYKK